MQLELKVKQKTESKTELAVGIERDRDRQTERDTQRDRDRVQCISGRPNHWPNGKIISTQIIITFLHYLTGRTTVPKSCSVSSNSRTDAGDYRHDQEASAVDFSQV